MFGDGALSALDALGLITMIGVEQVNSTIGRLVSSRYTEYLPLLGAYVVVSKVLTESISGFAIHNISDGITTTDIAGWFARWCLAQDFSRGCSSVVWTVNTQWTSKEKRERRMQALYDTLLALTIGIIVNALLLAFTILQGDWWGIANASSMVISIIVRTYVLKSNRDAIDTVIEDHSRSEYSDQHFTKCFITFNNGKQINMFVPSGLIRLVFIDKPAVHQSKTSLAMHVAGWTAFTTHVVTIGMSGLATQVVTVFLIVMATVMTVFKFGCNDEIIGSKLHARITVPAKGQSTRRQDAFIYLNLTDSEEDTLIAWNIMPLKSTSESNTNWWNQYQSKKQNWRACHPALSSTKWSPYDSGTFLSRTFSSDGKLSITSNSRQLDDEK